VSFGYDLFPLPGRMGVRGMVERVFQHPIRVPTQKFAVQLVRSYGEG